MHGIVIRIGIGAKLNNACTAKTTVDMLSDTLLDNNLLLITALLSMMHCQCPLSLNAVFDFLQHAILLHVVAGLATSGHAVSSSKYCDQL